ncbi:MAG: hypothetical protein Q7S34_01890 [bacterium]|nr:hypothetical protein [bacterium]
MKIDLKNIKRFFKKKETATEQKPLRNPYRDWVVIFVFVVMMFIAVSAYSAYVFLGIQQETAFSAGDIVTPSVKKISPQKLDEALQLITNRQKTFEELKIKRPTIADPSI